MPAIGQRHPLSNVFKPFVQLQSKRAATAKHQYLLQIGANRDGLQTQRGHHSKQGNMAAVGEAAAFYLERSHPIGEGTGDLNHPFGGLGTH